MNIILRKKLIGKKITVFAIVAALVLSLLPGAVFAATAQLKTLKASPSKIVPANGVISTTLTLTSKNINDGGDIDWSVSGTKYDDLVELASATTVITSNKSINTLTLVGEVSKNTTIKVIAAYGSKRKTVSVKLYPTPDISVTIPSTKSLSIGEAYQLLPVTYPSDAAVSYASSNAAVATVSSSGLVTGVTAGTAVITATASKNGNIAADTMKVTVTGSSTGVTIESVSEVPTVSTTVGVPPVLPSTITVLLSNGTQQAVGVTWDAVNVAATGTKIVYGTLTNPSGVTNPNNVKALAVVTVGPALPLTSDMAIALVSPTGSGNTISVGGVTRAGIVSVVNNTTSVVLRGTTTTAQAVAVSGTAAAYVTTGGSGIAPTFTVDTSSIAAGGGSLNFMLKVSEANRASISYDITVTVAAGLDPTANIALALSSPEGSGNSITVGGGTKVGNVNVVSGTTSVVLTGTKTAAQSVVVSGPGSADVVSGGTSTAPTYTINTAAEAVAGGSKLFMLTVSEAGKGEIVYVVTVNVAAPPATADIALALTTPAPGSGNSISVGGSIYTGTVNVVNSTASVVLTATKTAAQTVSAGGVNVADVTVGGTDTAPTYTINTANIAESGGSKVFSLTVSEAGRSCIVYTVTVSVTAPTGPTSDMALALTFPAAGSGNTINITDGGNIDTVAIHVINGTGTVILTGSKTATQAVAVSGTNYDHVTASGTATQPTYTVNTSSVSSGGSKYFVLTVSEAGKTSIYYNVTVTVAAS